MSLYNLPTLDQLNEQVSECRKCSLRGMDVPIIGYGSASSLMFLFEYPDKDEALLGRPLESRQGLLFKKILDESSLCMDNIYITHTLKCNTNGKNQLNSCIESCKSWLWQELQIIKPKILITFGKIPTKLLLKPKSNFSLKEIAGEFYKKDYLGDIIISPWYSPSLLNQRSTWFFTQTKNFLNKIKRKLNEIT